MVAANCVCLPAKDLRCIRHIVWCHSTSRIVVVDLLPWIVSPITACYWGLSRKRLQVSALS